MNTVPENSRFLGVLMGCVGVAMLTLSLLSLRKELSIFEQLGYFSSGITRPVLGVIGSLSCFIWAQSLLSKAVTSKKTRSSRYVFIYFVIVAVAGLALFLWVGRR